MTDSVIPSPSPTPASVTRNPPVGPAAPVTPASASPEPEPRQRQPLTVDVARGNSGVFVYTLRDPATDTVVAVIPREEVVLDRDGRNFDQRV